MDAERSKIREIPGHRTPAPYGSRTHPGLLMIRGEAVSPQEVIEILHPIITDERLSRIREVVDSRTRTVVTVVEGAADRGNVSAVMRTAEGLGFCDFHLITSGHAYKQSRRTSQGAEKWIDVTVWGTANACMDALHDRGYRIVSTSPDPAAVPIETIDFTRKTALVFGNELEGVSRHVTDRSDVVARIALNGFVESYNISVAAALCLYHTYRDRLARQGFHGDLSDEDHESLVAVYCMRAVQRGEQIVAEGLRRRRRG